MGRYNILVLILLQTVSLGAADIIQPATLVLEGETLFEFRTRVGSVSPADRVRLITARLNRILEDPLIDLNSISVQEEADIGWKVMAGDNLLLVITPEDAKGENRPGKLIAASVAFRIKEIAERDRKAKSPRELLISSLFALLYTVTIILLLLGIRYLHRRLLSTLKLWQGTVIRSVHIKTLEVLPAERISRILSWLLGATRFVLTLSILYFYIPLVLRLFPWTAQISPLLIGYVANPLKQIGAGFLAFIPNLFFIVINILVTRYILKFIRIFFTEIEKGSLQFSGFYPEWGEPTYQVVRILAIAFSIVIIFPYIPGSSSAAFQGVSVFLGLIVSLGSSSAISNLIAGLVLTYMRSFCIGDRVRIADTVGDVVEKTLLVTRISTVKNVEISIPNSLVLGSHIINFSTSAKTKGLILHTEVTIGYDAPWRKVHELLLNAALRSSDILQEPAPFILQKSLDDSYVRYELNAYTRQANSMARVYSSLHQNIQDAFNEAGVEIMSPSFSAIRDGNTITIPEGNRPPGYEPPSFRTKSYRDSQST
jgi:small-conductance mechanosensitive channel